MQISGGDSIRLLLSFGFVYYVQHSRHAWSGIHQRGRDRWSCSLAKGNKPINGRSLETICGELGDSAEKLSLL